MLHKKKLFEKEISVAKGFSAVDFTFLSNIYTDNCEIFFQELSKEK